MRLVFLTSALACMLAAHPCIAQSSSQTGSDASAAQASDRSGVEILSDTRGVDLSAWLMRWHRETERNWKIPKQSKPSSNGSKTIKAAIRFKVLPSGRLKDGSMALDSPSGVTAFDRSAWIALVNSKYPPLPSDFDGPFIELRAHFVYDSKAQH